MDQVIHYKGQRIVVQNLQRPGHYLFHAYVNGVFFGVKRNLYSAKKLITWGLGQFQ